MGRHHLVQSTLALSASLLSIAACSAGGNKSSGLLPAEEPTSSGGSGPGIAGSTSDPLTPEGSGNTGFDLGGDLGDPVEAPGCQQAEREFAPKIPTVFMLVDRSATMFDAIPGTNNVSAWSALRVGALEVMRELEGSVRFGFGAFAGRGPTDQCALELTTVPAAIANFGAIAGMYQPLEKPAPEIKETPTSVVLPKIADQLRADPFEGDKYILFVTDGEPDYCDDGNARCPPDSVVSVLQKLASPVDDAGQPQVPIQTLIFGITSPGANVRASVLQAFANAGAGLPVAPLVLNENEVYDPLRVYNECRGVPGWLADFTAAGKGVGETIATYAADPTLGGAAPVYRPDPTDQAALTEQIRTALAGVKSCTFDLAEDGVEVDLMRADLGERAHVIVNGTAVPLDSTNGWHMLTETTVQLEGSACSDWRNPTIETSISFDFPCEIFVPQ